MNDWKTELNWTEWMTKWTERNQKKGVQLEVDSGRSGWEQSKMAFGYKCPWIYVATFLCGTVEAWNGSGHLKDQREWKQKRSACLFNFCSCLFSLCCVQLFVTPWTAAHQAPLSLTISWSLSKLMSIESMMPTNLILYWFLLFLPSIFPSIRVFSNASALCKNCPKYWRFSVSINPSNECLGLISFRIVRGLNICSTFQQ